jgi:putative hydrolase of the HAD superfamily
MKLVTLDVTNTCIKIVGSVGLHYASYVYHKTGMRLNEEKVNKYFRIHYKSMMEEHPNFGRYTSMGSRKWWDSVVTNTLKEAGLDKTIAVDQLYDEFITPKHWAVHEDVIEFIRTIRCNGIQVGVISNFDERLGLVNCAVLSLILMFIRFHAG